MAIINQPSFPASIQVVIGTGLNGWSGLAEDQVLTLSRHILSSDKVYYSEDGTPTAKPTNRIQLEIRASVNGDGFCGVHINYLPTPYYPYSGFVGRANIRNWNGTAFADSIYTHLDVARTAGGIKYHDFALTNFQSNSYGLPAVTQFWGVSNSIFKSISGTISPTTAPPTTALPTTAPPTTVPPTTVPPTTAPPTTAAPPVFNTIEIIDNSFLSSKVKVNLDQDSVTYMVCLPNEDPAPTSQQVKDGQDGSGAPVASNLKDSVETDAGVDGTLTVTDLDQFTHYDLHVVAEGVL